MIADFKLRSKLTKLHAMAHAATANPHVRRIALEAFNRTCRRFKIDPKTIRLDGYSHDGKNVIELLTEATSVEANLRAVCLLMGEFWPVQIRAVMVRHHGRRVRLDFVSQEPISPADAVEAFKYIYEQVDHYWKILLERYEEARTGYHNPSPMYRPISPQKKSFTSGFFHGLHDRLKGEKRRRAAHKLLVAPVAVPRQPYQSSGPPDFNPLALMCLPREATKNTPDIESPCTGDIPPVEETDPEFREADPVDQDSLTAGYQLSKRIDLMKLNI